MPEQNVGQAESSITTADEPTYPLAIDTTALGQEARLHPPPETAPDLAQAARRERDDDIDCSRSGSWGSQAPVPLTFVADARGLGLVCSSV